MASDRYAAIEAHIRDMFNKPLMQEALEALRRCPRRAGTSALGAYYCECPACEPDLWGLESPGV